ncbi:hypothetical protein HDV05_000193, partial [Chytridiales sp. JEL 0842]
MSNPRIPRTHGIPPPAGGRIPKPKPSLLSRPLNPTDRNQLNHNNRRLQPPTAAPPPSKLKSSNTALAVPRPPTDPENNVMSSDYTKLNPKEFKTYNFFFLNLDPNTVNDFRKAVQRCGALLNSKDVLDTRAWGKTIITDREFRILMTDNLRYHWPENRPNLEDLRRTEKIIGPPTKNNAQSQYVEFTGTYLIVEDTTGQLQPIWICEFEKEEKSVPQLHLDRLSSGCPFFEHSRGSEDGNKLPHTSEEEEYEESERSSVDNDDENGGNAQHHVRHKPYGHGEAITDTNASGLNNSASVRPTDIANTQAVPLIQALQKRTIESTKQEVNLDENEESGVDLKRRKVRKKGEKKHFMEHKGYCQSCRENYDNYRQHIQTKKHRGLFEND